ncbi:rhomboid domain-containing protein 2 [Polypterus senegalus]|uniref:rhomboid domain-containing protein 2 n=1 Tax=Polypterus senegalus TaxID=55291 RepID=UPI001962F269|nr:rhomboid domain-containing protein 2 [Polypterus senegalus]
MTVFLVTTMKSFIHQLEITSATLATLLLCAGVFVTTALFGVSPEILSLQPDGLAHLKVYKLLSYTFFHADINSLLCNIVILWYFGISLEKSVGTVKYCYYFVIFSVFPGLLCIFLEYVLYGLEGNEDLQGLTSVVFAMIGMSSVKSSMRRTLFFGINIPTVAVPWLLLIFALAVPGSSFLCNVSSIIIGKIYGKGFCVLLDFSEAKASLLDKKMPFRFLRKWEKIGYVPASLSERRSMQQKRINPRPGLYPTQAYAPVQNNPVPHRTDPYFQAHGGWVNSASHHFAESWQMPLHGRDPRQLYESRHGQIGAVCSEPSEIITLQKNPVKTSGPLFPDLNAQQSTF